MRNTHRAVNIIQSSVDFTTQMDKGVKIPVWSDGRQRISLYVMWTLCVWLRNGEEIHTLHSGWERDGWGRCRQYSSTELRHLPQAPASPSCSYCSLKHTGHTKNLQQKTQMREDSGEKQDQERQREKETHQWVWPQEVVQEVKRGLSLTWSWHLFCVPSCLESWCDPHLASMMDRFN